MECYKIQVGFKTVLQTPFGDVSALNIIFDPRANNFKLTLEGCFTYFLSIEQLTASKLPVMIDKLVQIELIPTEVATIAKQEIEKLS
jgi:hypothetical protein